MRPRVCFLGGMRYCRPLDPTQEKKWRMLCTVGELFVIGFSENLWPQCFHQHARFYLLPKAPLAPLRYGLLLTVGPTLALWCILRHRVAILTAQSPHEGFAAAVAKQFAGLLGRRVVLVVESHGDFEMNIFLQRTIKLRALHRWMMRVTARYSLKRADLCRAVSYSTLEQLSTWAPRIPVVQFAAWTDLDQFLDAGKDRSVRSPPTIVYAGILVPGKGLHHLLGAFGRLKDERPDISLQLIGREANSGYAAELRAQARRHGLGERVAFEPELPQSELAERMAHAAVFVLPTVSEGLGRVVLEAMAAGVPVVASAVGGIPEIIEDGVTGLLVPPGDERALTAKIRWVLEHTVEAEEMSRRARAFSRRFFSSEAYVRYYSELFSEAERRSHQVGGAGTQVPGS